MLGPSDSTLQLSTKTFGPPETILDEIDSKVGDMINFLFDNGLREDDYRSVCEDEIVMTPSSCLALVPVECNSQILDAHRGEAKKTDFHLKEVNKDILRPASWM